MKAEARNETKMKQKWNRDETKMKQKWNRDETKMKQKWNKNETKTKRKWNKNETKMTKSGSIYIILNLYILYRKWQTFAKFWPKWDLKSATNHFWTKCKIYTDLK